MIAKLKGAIRAMRRITVDGVEWVELDIGLGGEFAHNRAAGKEVIGEVTLRLKPIYAAELRMTQPLAFELDTDPDRLPSR